MTHKIGLLGDVHAVTAPLEEALTILHREEVDEIWCTGDVAGYGDELAETVALLQANDCQVILGNHDQWYLELPKTEKDHRLADFLANLPRVKEAEIEGTNCYMVHASPPDSLLDGIRLLDESSQMLPEQKALWSVHLAGFIPDVLIVGHTHQVFCERLAETLVINPGSTLFNHACAVLSLPTMTVKLHGLSGRTPLLAWHWGLPGQSWP